MREENCLGLICVSVNKQAFVLSVLDKELSNWEDEFRSHISQIASIVAKFYSHLSKS